MQAVRFLFSCLQADCRSVPPHHTPPGIHAVMQHAELSPRLASGLLGSGLLQEMLQKAAGASMAAQQVGGVLLAEAGCSKPKVNCTTRRAAACNVRWVRTGDMAPDSVGNKVALQPQAHIPYQ